MFNEVISKFSSYISSRREVQKEATIVCNYKKYLKQGEDNRYALLSYLPNPVQASLRYEDINQFSNDGLGISWAKVLNSLGYIVDIISWDDTTFIPKKNYDLFVGHGGKNFEYIHKQLNHRTKSIYFSTGSYWKYHNIQEVKRFEDFKSRHGVTLRYDRYIHESEEYANKIADGIICLGNLDCKKTYDKFTNVYNLNIGCFPDQNTRSSSTIGSNLLRRNFLFLSGGGNIHKGLDIVLDTFSMNSHYNLFVMTRLDRDFENFYHDILKLPNINYVGFTPMRSKKYYNILDKCSYLVFPSCSEGSPGSVVETMQRNILPIVSKESHIDVTNFGIKLENSTTSELQSAIDKVTKYSTKTFIKKANLAATTVKTRHSPENFEIELTKAVQKILT